MFPHLGHDVTSLAASDHGEFVGTHSLGAEKDWSNHIDQSSFSSLAL